MARYDVFIAYARPDEPHARELYEALAAALGKDRIFFDREQPAGNVWRQEIPTALVDSRLTVAVLSRTPNGGWYDKSELIIAVDQMRHGEQLLIPLFVNGTPEHERDWPYGLQGLNAIDARGRGGIGPAADEIVTRLRALPPSGVAEMPRPKTRRELLNAALHLDRADQWGAIQKIAHGDGDAYFLLYGQVFQNLRLFVERILHRLGKEVRPHRVLELPYRLDSTRAANVAEWEMRLVRALQGRLGGGGRLEELLLRAASREPLFMIIELPFNLSLDRPHKAALQSFLEDRLPELMERCGGRGKRLLVAAEYLDAQRSRHDALRPWMLRAAERWPISYEPMAEVETPRRSDVVAYLERVGFYKGHPEFDDILRGYDALATDTRLTFDVLSNFLDAQLASVDPDEEDE